MPRKPLSRRSNKKLTQQQQLTVNDNLEKRIEKLRQKKATEATVISHMGYNIIIQETPDSPLVACDWRQNIGPICAGDQVLISYSDQQKNEAKPIIEIVLPRNSVIEKQNVYRGAKPFAANIDQMIVIITHEPMFQPSLLDRYIMMASVIGIDCLVYFNKIDILTAPKVCRHIDEMQRIYQSIPKVTWVRGSTKLADGLDELEHHLAHRHTVITGQSGVGKSSLINALIPNLAIQTKSISEASGLGRHSTTNSTLYRLGKSGILIDTPGVRSFDTYHLSVEAIRQGFAEIAPYLGYCQFSDCSHTHEKKCALKDAVQAEKVSELRYNSFLQILSEVN